MYLSIKALRARLYASTHLNEERGTRNAERGTRNEERGTRNAERGGGSLTALPIIETEAQNISAYIPTNLISITDGQIYLSPSLFELGVLPAVDVGKSVSRVGGKAQRPTYRAVAGDLKLAYAQFEELETFARSGASLDEGNQLILEHGRRIRACLKQPEATPVPVPAQITLLLALAEELLDQVPIDKITCAERAVYTAAAALPAEVRAHLESNAPFADDDRDMLIALATETLASFLPVAKSASEPGSTLCFLHWVSNNGTTTVWQSLVPGASTLRTRPLGDREVSFAISETHVAWLDSKFEGTVASMCGYAEAELETSAAHRPTKLPSSAELRVWWASTYEDDTYHVNVPAEGLSEDEVYDVLDFVVAADPRLVPVRFARGTKLQLIQAGQQVEGTIVGHQGPNQIARDLLTLIIKPTTLPQAGLVLAVRPERLNPSARLVATMASPPKKVRSEARALVKETTGRRLSELKNAKLAFYPAHLRSGKHWYVVLKTNEGHSDVFVLRQDGSQKQSIISEEMSAEAYSIKAIVDLDGDGSDELVLHAETIDSGDREEFYLIGQGEGTGAWTVTTLHAFDANAS